MRVIRGHHTTTMRPPSEYLTLHFWVFLFSSHLIILIIPNVEVRPPAEPDSSILGSFNLHCHQGEAWGGSDPVIMSEKALVCNYRNYLLQSPTISGCKSFRPNKPSSINRGSFSYHIYNEDFKQFRLHPPQNMKHTQATIWWTHCPKI